MITTKQLRPHRFLTLRLFLFNLCGLLLAVLLLNNTANSAAVDPRLLLLSNFETGNIQARTDKWDGWSEQACYSYNFDIVTSPVRAGNYALKIFLKKSDSYKCFDDLRPRAQIYQDITKLQLRVGHWVGYSQFIPDDVPSTANTAFASFKYNIQSSIAVDGKEYWHRRWGSPGQGQEGSDYVYSSTYTKGEWVDWVVYYYPSWENDGILKIWKNGNLVVNANGANCIADKMGWSPLSFKIYKPDAWNGYDELAVYFDEIRMTRGTDTQEYYDLVAPPPRSSQVPVPTEVDVSSPGK